MKNKKNLFRNILNNLTFEYQPIVHLLTGELLGIEVFIKNYNNLGFNSLSELFEKLNKENLLIDINLELQKEIIEHLNYFNKKNLLLFYNLNYRIIHIINKIKNNKKFIKWGNFLSENNICIELNENDNTENIKDFKKVIKFFKNTKTKITINNFGYGTGCLKILYNNDINFLKINRSFISNINKDYKKQVLADYIVHLSHLLGIKIIASGIKTKKELLMCKNLNIDYIQGDYIQTPTSNIKDIKNNYDKIYFIIKKEKKDYTELNEKLIEYIEPININENIYKLLEKIKEDPFIDVIPVVNDEDKFLGIINKKEIIKILITPYGYNILQNGRTQISSFLIPFFTIDKNTDINTLLRLYTQRKDKQHGVIVTSNDKYIGYVKDSTIIELSYKRNLEYAQDLNPLTKLPGNKKIEEFIQESISSYNEEKKYYICYIDLDNFKPFNDKYGFRQGDRVLTLFANILKKKVSTRESLIGHIGGDDFFVGFKTNDYFLVYQKISNIINKFKKNVIDFYNEEDKEKGYLLGKDRDCNLKKFPFLTASAIIIEINKGNTKKEIDEILQKTKSLAKKTDFPIFVSIN